MKFPEHGLKSASFLHGPTPTAPPIYELEEAEVQAVEKTQLVEKSSDNPFADSMDDTFNRLGDMLRGPVATGITMSLGELLGGGMPISPQPAAAAPPAPVVQQASSPSPFGFQFVLPAVTVAVPQEPASGSKKRGVRSISSGGPGGASAKAEPAPGAGQKRLKVGRPKRDVLTDMKKVVQEFEEASELDTTWFADNFRTRDRNTKRLLQDVVGRLSSSECSAEESGELTVLQKQVEVALNISKFIATHGSGEMVIRFVAC